MHRVIRNELRLALTIIPVTPLLVASGADGDFVRCPHPDEGAPTAYLPGTALKGTFRASAEQLMSGSDVHCCDPSAPCHTQEAIKRAAASADGAAIYRALCGICQIFGSRALSSHLSITDAYPAEPLNDLTIHDLPEEDGTCESVMGDAFYTLLTLRNFERWQIGLLGAALSRINAGDTSIGANRGYGMGRVLIRCTMAVVTYFGFYEDAALQALSERLHGIGSLIDVPNAYDFSYPDAAEKPDLPRGAQFNTGFGYAEVVLDSNIGEPRAVHIAISELLHRQLPLWQSYLMAHRIGS